MYDSAASVSVLLGSKSGGDRCGPGAQPGDKLMDSGRTGSSALTLTLEFYFIF